MPEHVTTFGGGPFRGRNRVLAVTERFGGARGEIREPTRRDAEAVFKWLAAARGRYPITRVTRHVCQHDQGVGDCSSVVVEG